VNTRKPNRVSVQRGVGLVETIIGLVIGMLMVLMIFQVYQVNEGQKRTVTGGSDAQQNAGYGLFMIGRDISIAGNGIAPSAVALDGCALLRPVPVVITAGATDNDPDSVTALYGGSSSLSTPVAFLGNATIASASSAGPYQVASPIGFSPNDVIAAVQGANCTLSTINTGGVVVSSTTGYATITHTPIAGNMATTYNAISAALVNLGPAASASKDPAVARAMYFIDTATNTLRTQNHLPLDGTINTVVSDVVNLKAQFGLDTDNDGTVDTWQAATGLWSTANLATQPLATLLQIRAVRVAIVTRSEQYEKNVVTPGPLLMFDGVIKMNLTADQQHYRYKELETIVPLRNAVWNAS
jgi:type IV pilus assembly protein PilW